MSDRRDSQRSPFEAWAAQLEALARMQQMMAGMALPADQLRSVREGFNQLLIPQQQLDAMRDMMEALTPPAAQVRSIAERVDEQLAQLKAIEKELRKFQGQLERFIALGQHLAAIQEPLARMADLFAPERRPPTPEA